MENLAYETQDADLENIARPQALTEKNGINKDAERGVDVATTRLDLIYSIHDTPPWYLTIFLGLQHFLTAFGGILSIPYVVMPAMCSTEPVALAEVINTNFFVSGVITVVQASLGVRLPIVQGGTFAFIAPTLAILSLPEWKCPEANTTTVAYSNATLPEVDSDIWKSRMNEISGAIILASLFQVVIGFTGVVGMMLRFIGPLVIAPTITLIGIALFGTAAFYCSSNWWMALLTMALMTLFSQYMPNVGLPCCFYQRNGGCSCKKYPFFKLYPIILAVVISWMLCAILTVTDAIPDDPDHWAYSTRTDTNREVLTKSKWFRFPYPGQWGAPTFSAAAVFGILAGVIAGIVESVGDYYACARLSGAPPPPVHALNRGIFIEGVGCVLNGLWGTGTGSASYSANVAAIGLTKVGSTHVAVAAGIIMILCGVVAKLGALFVTIPDPVVGGMFMVLFGLVAAVGISNLQFVDMNSSRNLFVFGFSLFFGLSLPLWIEANPNAINTGNDVVDQIITVLLSTSMFVGGTLAFILDNTISGTEEERGIHVWCKVESAPSASGKQKTEAQCYDLPLGMNFIRKWEWTKYLPICPTFVNCCAPRKNLEHETVESIRL